MAIRDVTDLRVYNQALASLELVYQLARQVPNTHERLRKQIINSAESISPLIAEGFAKKVSAKEFRHYLTMAMGSSDETITHAREIFLLAKIVKTIDKQLCIKVGERYKSISKQLNRLIKNWIDYTKS